MNKKCASVISVLALLVVCLALPGGNAAAGNQSISGRIDKAFGQPVMDQAITVSDNITTDNQTLDLTNPTFEEMKDFILKDTTSRNKFVLNKYECRHFATDVNNNAEAAGLRCAFALLCYREGQHAVVAFETTDRGLIFIEPQTDAAIQPKVGGRYQNQEIIEILVSW